MSNKRLYSRLPLVKEIVLYIDHQEYACTLQNISENGLALEVVNDPPIDDSLIEGNTVQIVLYDNYKYMNSIEREVYFVLQGIVAHYRKTENNLVFMGVQLQFRHKSYVNYVSEKKQMDYLNTEIDFLNI